MTREGMESEAVGVERRRLPFTLIENVVIEDQELGAVDILVYMALAKHVDEDGVCWPSMSIIGKLARCVRQTVAKSITRLETCGYLRRTARFRPDGGVTSNVYQLLQLKVDPPAAQDDTLRQLERQAPVSRVTRTISNLNKTQRKKERHDHSARRKRRQRHWSRLQYGACRGGGKPARRGVANRLRIYAL
jgi:hypothetical protein